MKYYSTKNSNKPYSFKEAVLKGLPDDNGLFVSENIPLISQSILDNLESLNIRDIGYEIARLFIEDEIPPAILRNIIDEAINFEAPLHLVEPDIYSLELYHGPTLAFKDFGARFMARIMQYFNQSSDKKLRILVATSGDTGGAVASGFLGMKNIEVIILFPKDRVSFYQQKQLTTLGDNIRAIAIEGGFDDCQYLVKQAFLDDSLKEKINMSSANSINISRLIPQMFYYFASFGQLKPNGKKVIYSVPSGNLGNLTAGLYAKKMGLGIDRFIAANNANQVFSQYLLNGVYKNSASIATLSNAMDVGDPSNFYRIMHLYGSTWNQVCKDILPFIQMDTETIKSIKECKANADYLCDPHGAISYQGIADYIRLNKNHVGVFLETAHPAKFKEEVEKVTGISPEIPADLGKLNDKIENFTTLYNSYSEFKNYLLALD